MGSAAALSAGQGAEDLCCFGAGGDRARGGSHPEYEGLRSPLNLSGSYRGSARGEPGRTRGVWGRGRGLGEALKFSVKPDLICNSKICSHFVTGRKMFLCALPYQLPGWLCYSPLRCVGRVVDAVLVVQRRGLPGCAQSHRRQERGCWAPRCLARAAAV